MLQYRDRSEILSRILDIGNGAVDITKTKLMAKAFLSYTQTKQYLTILIESDLISYDSITHTYKTTEKGLRLLQFYNQLDDMMRKDRSSNDINNHHLRSTDKHK